MLTLLIDTKWLILTKKIILQLMKYVSVSFSLCRYFTSMLQQEILLLYGHWEVQVLNLKCCFSNNSGQKILLMTFCHTFVCFFSHKRSYYIPFALISLPEDFIHVPLAMHSNACLFYLTVGWGNKSDDSKGIKDRTYGCKGINICNTIWWQHVRTI